MKAVMPSPTPRPVRDTCYFGDIRLLTNMRAPFGEMADMVLVKLPALLLHANPVKYCIENSTSLSQQ